MEQKKEKTISIKNYKLITEQMHSVSGMSLATAVHKTVSACPLQVVSTQTHATCMILFSHTTGSHVKLNHAAV